MDKKFYGMSGIYDFLGLDYYFERKKPYPFNCNRKDVTFSWGQVLIPRKGIREMVQNKISDIKDQPLHELFMMYQTAFQVNDKRGTKIGLINQNISLSFRYDKTYKYGDINKSIYECCFFILEHSVATNDFYIITDEYLFEFFSYYIIDNQWGIGAMTVSSPCMEKYFVPKNPWDSECINCSHLDSGGKCTLDIECHDHSEFSWGTEPPKAEVKSDIQNEVLSDE